MDKNRIQKFLSSTRVLQFVFFVAAVTLVTYFFPREGKFRYTFQEGKPWKYGLLTAPFDFPVYKDEAVIQQERDSIMLDFQPVFSHNESIEKKSVDDFEKALSNYTEMSIPPTLRKNLVQALREAYRKGIVSSEAYTRLQSGKFKEIRILENNVAREIPVSELQSAREAYENMLNKFPDSYSHHILQTCNLNDFLNTNSIVLRPTGSKTICYNESLSPTVLFKPENALSTGVKSSRRKPIAFSNRSKPSP